MQRLVVLLCLMLLGLWAAAARGGQEEKKRGATVMLYGQVYDAFTGAVVKAHLTLMQAEDSAVVDTTTVRVWERRSDWWMEVPRREGRYVVKGEADGYETAFLQFDMVRLRRNNLFEVPQLRMRKLADREVDLGEGVVITGTRIRMVYRGDTLVYNAAAFSLPEGSMLDALVRQLPGAELKDNGDIYVNGRKVDYLTLNGTDFFSGNNKMMLDNLPYYTVQDIKVYDKTSHESRHRGYEATRKDYVMDVNLKRQYNRAYIANVEAGAGLAMSDNDEATHPYMGRLFGLYFDDLSRYTLFANTNNVNENRHPGDQGEWSPSDMPTGLRTIRQVGANVSVANKAKTLDENFSALVEWSDAREETRTERETFFGGTDDSGVGGNVFGGGNTASRQKDFRVNVENRLELEGKHNLLHNINLTLTDGHMDTQENDSTYRQRIINQSRSASHRRYRNLEGHTALDWDKHLPWGDNLWLRGSLGGMSNKPSETHSRQLTSFASSDAQEERHYYEDTHESGYEWKLAAGYTFALPRQWHIGFDYEYEQRQHNYYNSTYRLDWLGQMAVASPMGVSGDAQGASGAYTARPLVYLPSTQEALDGVLDLNNSDTHHHLERNHQVALHLSTSSNKRYFMLQLPLRRVAERMHYLEPQAVDTVASRTDWLFQPTLTYAKWGKHNILAIYSLKQTRPDFASLMVGDDFTNPLRLVVNNTQLRRQRTHNLYAYCSTHNDSTNSDLSLGGTLWLTQDSWGSRRVYVSNTGAYLSMNDNVNGNWGATLNLAYKQPVGRNRLWTVENHLAPSFEHSVDFDLYTTTTPQEAAGEVGDDLLSLLERCPLAHVDNLTLNDRVRLNFHKESLALSFVADATWRGAWSSRQDFQRISTWDWSYGVVGRYTIPGAKLTVSTDLKMFQRRGYGSSLMNSDDLIWNAELSRPFFRGQLVARLQAFDLLGQLSTRQYTLNAQGRTETWTLCLPRYALLTLQWRLKTKREE